MKSETPKTVAVLYWHRTDLRLHDSPALGAALALKPSIFIPVWTWDPHYVYRTRVGANRMKFLLESQADLSKSYTRLNPKQKLFVIREAPQTALPKLWNHWNITHLVFEKDTDPYARERDERIMAMAADAGIEVVVRMGRNLFDPDELVAKNGGKPTMSFSQVEKAAEKVQNGQPDRPLPAPETIPDPWDEARLDLTNLTQDRADPEPDLNSNHRPKHDTQYAQLTGPDHSFSVPTLEEVGIEPGQATTPHQGGESVALSILKNCLGDQEYIGRFEKPKTSPAAFEPQSTMLLSPHLHFGSISVRRIWWDVQNVLEERKRQKKPNTSVPTNIPGQLLFREMYFAAQAAVGSQFSHTRGNKVVLFIDWHLPSNVSPTPDGKWLVNGPYHRDSDQAEEWFQKWKRGVTGFPWIDALMRQLRQEGWIHHLGRHSVACFLTRGGCYVDWERGAEVFEELLIDRKLNLLQVVFPFFFSLTAENQMRRPPTWETGCGYLARPFSTSTIVVIPPSPLARNGTRTDSSLGGTVLSCPGSTRSISLSRGKHRSQTRSSGNVGLQGQDCGSQSKQKTAFRSIRSQCLTLMKDERSAWKK